MPVVRRRNRHDCNVLRLRLLKNFWARSLRQEVCKGRLRATSEAALRHRIPKIMAFFNTDVLHTLTRGEGTPARAATRSGVTYLFHQ